MSHTIFHPLLHLHPYKSHKSKKPFAPSQLVVLFTTSDTVEWDIFLMGVDFLATGEIVELKSKKISGTNQKIRTEPKPPDKLKRHPTMPFFVCAFFAPIHHTHSIFHTTRFSKPRTPRHTRHASRPHLPTLTHSSRRHHASPFLHNPTKPPLLAIL